MSRDLLFLVYPFVKSPIEKTIEAFEQGIYFLEQAVTIFSDQVDEPIRLWEAQNELGCIYRDWGDCVRTHNLALSKQKHRQSQQFHERALNVAQEHNLLFQLADTYDDLAQVAVSQDDINLAKHWQEQVDKLIALDYDLNSLPNSQDEWEQGDAYWLILGKTNWQKAQWYLKSLESSRVSELERAKTIQTCLDFFGLVLVCFQKYWPDTTLVKSRYNRMISLLHQHNINMIEAIEKIKNIAEQHQCELKLLSD